MRGILAVLLLLSIGCTDARAARCAELSRQYEAALTAPAPQAPADARVPASTFRAYETAVAAHNQRIADARRAYEVECKR